ncbi:MAG: 4Fe-4S dicluster domain-containing protein [Candidatus Brocadiia bacterium]
MQSALDGVLRFLEPLTSPFLALLVCLLLPSLAVRFSGRKLALALLLLAVSFFGAYELAAASDSAHRWLIALNTPLVTVFLFVILPALHLPRNRYYKLFLLLPAALVVAGIAAIFVAYATVPDGKDGFYWLLIRPAFLMGLVASALVLVQPFLTMKVFRRAMRISLFAILIYGGFALRQDYLDYQQMLDHRAKTQGGVVALTETRPVTQNDNRMTYLPSAPCRFSADGGYVQGCNMELLQRIAMLDVAKTVGGDPAAISNMAIVLAALLMFMVIVFLTARITCGWLCPLSTMGSALDYVRRKLRLPYFKPSPAVRSGVFYSGLGLAGLTLLMAKLVPSLDANGYVLGCKIPIYPFCKICPGQQVCPVATQGLAGYPPLPSSEWAWGFFKVFTLLLLVFFLLAFIAARRLWCLFCPMGMLSGIFNRGGMFALAKASGKCNRCGACAEVCPMGIDKVRSEMQNSDVSSYDCVLCLRCVEKCPRNGCLSLTHCGRKITESRFTGKQ